MFDAMIDLPRRFTYGDGVRKEKRNAPRDRRRHRDAVMSLADTTLLLKDMPFSLFSIYATDADFCCVHPILMRFFIVA